MLPFFKRDKDKGAPDVKTLRHSLLQFIKEQLQKAEGGEGGNIKGLQVYLACSDADKHLYEAAVYLEDENKFKTEIQKIADDFALGLPEQWTLELIFTGSVPAEALPIPGTQAALLLLTRRQPGPKAATTAYLKIIQGEAEKENYTITSADGKIPIGRGKKVQTAEGFYRENVIAFSDAESNKFVSRQHAHIRWNDESGMFMLYADEGGVPPRNKIKIRTTDGGLVKLHTTQIGHPLQPGDQIILGESTLLEFSNKP